jgi:hypothetical protein
MVNEHAGAVRPRASRPRQLPQTSPSNVFFSRATGLSARRARAMGVSPNSEANRTMSLAALFEVEDQRILNRVSVRRPDHEAACEQIVLPLPR